ncbi:MAG TPA: hypothetical protein VKK61_01720 [Tepidisphaeraceae bacterium]|nr:hypothetical protein [Tepidisphaeraceae bacterium]
MATAPPIFQYRFFEMDGETVLEIRPERERFSPSMIAVDFSEKSSGNWIKAWITVSGNPKASTTMFNSIQSAGELDGVPVWYFSADNTLDPTYSFYLRCKKIPSRIWIGGPGNLTKIDDL